MIAGHCGAGRRCCTIGQMLSCRYDPLSRWGGVLQAERARRVFGRHACKARTCAPITLLLVVEMRPRWNSRAVHALSVHLSGEAV